MKKIFKMKKVFNFLFVLALPLAATYGIWEYYQSLPIRGAYETGPVHYPSIDREKLKSQLAEYSVEDLEKMRTAGLEATKWQNLLAKVDATVVSDIIKNFDNFFIGERYPHDESYDADSKCSYFYHSHRPKEHGHFHIYYSNQKVMKKYKPIASWDRKHLNTHLAAISMHPNGDPIGFFIPNHWITKDEWFKSEDMEEMITHFEINNPYPSWPSNQWVGQILKLFYPQIKTILKDRDHFIANINKPLEKVLKDRKLDVIASISISIQDQMEIIEELLNEKLNQKTCE